MPYFSFQLAWDVAGGIRQNSCFTHLFTSIHIHAAPGVEQTRKSRWRRASYTPTATVFDKFRLRASGIIGRRTQASLVFYQ